MMGTDFKNFIGAVVVLTFTHLLLFSKATPDIEDLFSDIPNKAFERLWEVERIKGGALDYYESWLHCCGVNSSEDYGIIHHAIPSSCCLDNKCVDQSSVYKVGCKAKFTEYLNAQWLVFKVIYWLLVIGEGVEAVLAWLLYRSIRSAQLTEEAIPSSGLNSVASKPCSAVNI